MGPEYTYGAYRVTSYGLTDGQTDSWERSPRTLTH